MTEGRLALPADIAEAVGVAIALAQHAPQPACLALVGSWSRGSARPDSDVDLVLLTDDPDSLLKDDSWHARFGAGAALVRAADFGPLQERRLRLPTGLVVELCIGRPSWAEVPVDPGTKRVVADGFQPLWDPHGRLAALLSASEGEG